MVLGVSWPEVSLPSASGVSDMAGEWCGVGQKRLVASRISLDIVSIPSGQPGGTLLDFDDSVRLSGLA
jgi:hypothetical protein